MFVTSLALACGGRADLGVGSDVSAGDPTICPRVVGPDFKIAYDGYTTPGANVWHSRDSSVVPFPFERVGAFSYDGNFMGVADAGISYMFGANEQQLRMQPSPATIVVYYARPRCDGNRLLVFGYGTSPTDTRARFGVLNPDATYHEIAVGGFLDVPVYGPDGSTILFCEVSPDGTQYTLETIRDDGSNRTNLMTSTAATRFPAFSFDGKQVVYATFGVATFGLAVLDLELLTSSAILPDSASTIFGWPSFTPDGSGVVFVETATDTLDTSVRRVDLATHEITTLFGGQAANNLLSYGINLAAD